jgi:L-aminopeptidase/D-esterase-like protein
MWDGDTVFALGTGAVAAEQPALESMAMRTVAEAIRRGVRLAEPLGGLPAVAEAGGLGDS